MSAAGGASSRLDGSSWRGSSLSPVRRAACDRRESRTPPPASLSALSDATLTAGGAERERLTPLIQPLMALPPSATYETLDPNCNFLPVRHPTDAIELLCSACRFTSLTQVYSLVCTGVFCEMLLPSDHCRAPASREPNWRRPIGQHIPVTADGFGARASHLHQYESCSILNTSTIISMYAFKDTPN